MNEAFQGAAATQRADIGDFKKFCLNISTVSLPNLILPELMLVQPMSSLSGYITYLRYSAGTNKGGVMGGKNATVFNDAFRLGVMDEDRSRYTSSAISEKYTITAENFSNKSIKLEWSPVVDVKAVKFTSKDGNVTDLTVVNKAPEKKEEVQVTIGTVDGVDRVATLTFHADLFKDDSAAGSVISTLYLYDNEIIPQTVKPVSLPTLTAKMEVVNLHAHARRIAVYYSQLAAFQAKNDYGYDLGQQLSAQAQGELAYEIDSEGVMMLYKGAEHDSQLDMPRYSAAVAGAISRSQYYEMFTEVIARAKAIIYQRTQKFAPNYMVVAPDVLTVMPYLKGWVAAPAAVVNGPYFAGTVDSVKVFVSPAMRRGEFFFGVNGTDLQTSAAVYAPYMAIVPTQLLGFADGTMSQGFSTMYDMKLLSTYNAVQKVTGIEDSMTSDKTDAEDGQYSWLLVAGMMVDDPKDDYLGVFVKNTAADPVNTKAVI